MAMVDYGVIAKKNGKVVTTDLFTKMIDTLGVEYEFDTEGRYIKDNYFVFLGDAEFYVAIYKESLYIFNKNRHIDTIYYLDYYANTRKGKKFRYKTTINGITFDIKRFDDGYRYIVRFRYKGDVYEAIYGYGVDLDINNWYDLKHKDKIRLQRWLNNG